MSTSQSDRYSTKIQRKIRYLENLISYFGLIKFEPALQSFSREFSQAASFLNQETKLTSLISLNNRMKTFKKQIENSQFNQYSNTRAFHMKAALKGIPLVLIYDKLFSTLEIKGNFPDIMEINTQIFLYPVDMLVLTAEKVLVQNKPSSSIKLETIQCFMQRVIESYNHVSYHHFSHGFSVMQMFYFMMNRAPDIGRLLSPEMKYAGLIATISHDLAHRKTNKPARITFTRFRNETSWPKWGARSPFWRSSIARFS